MIYLPKEFIGKEYRQRLSETLEFCFDYLDLWGNQPKIKPMRHFTAEYDPKEHTLYLPKDMETVEKIRKLGIEHDMDLSLEFIAIHESRHCAQFQEGIFHKHNLHIEKEIFQKYCSKCFPDIKPEEFKIETTATLRWCNEHYFMLFATYIAETTLNGDIELYELRKLDIDQYSGLTCYTPDERDQEKFMEKFFDLPFYYTNCRDDKTEIDDYNDLKWEKDANVYAFAGTEELKKIRKKK